jgi:hypothetical protein
MIFLIVLRREAMNSYDFGISGTWWLLILGVLLSLAISIFVYRNTIPPIPQKKKTLLITLRAIALSLLIFILFEPVITRITGSEESQMVYVMLDNSISTGIKDAGGDRNDQYRKAIDNSDFTSLGEDKKKVALFSESLIELGDFDIDTIDHTGQMTNISNAFRQVTNNTKETNTQAALLITDGSFNEGDNPIYSATDFGKPVFIIGIGDTNSPRDISIQSILTNEIAYVGNPVPINVNVKKSGYSDSSITVEFLDNGKKIDEQKITFTPDKDEYSLIFEYTPETEGVRKLTFRSTAFDDEITNKNNTLSEFIRVLKNKRSIAIFAGAPSPDLSFIKNVLQSEKGVETKTYIQKQGAEFYGNLPASSEINESEMIVFIGFPITSTPQQVLDLVKNELRRGKPFLFVMSNEVDYRKLSTLDEFLPFTVMSSQRNEFMATADVKPDQLSSPLLRVLGNSDDADMWSKLPPIFRNETFFKPKPESEVAATIKVNNVAISEPLIITRSFRDQKSVAVLGYNLYRWKMLGYAQDVALGKEDSYDLFTIFFKNTFRWLSVALQEKNIIIKTTKSNYTSGEEIEFFAQIYDAAYTPIDNAEINIDITGENANTTINLTSIGNGRYRGSAGLLPSGDHFFNGVVNVDGNQLGKDDGRFSVGDIPLEYSELTMNINLLRNIAERTGGKFYLPEESGEFLNDLEGLRDFRPKPIVKRSEFVLWNLPWLLAIAIICLATEWFMRKRWGMI